MDLENNDMLISQAGSKINDERNNNIEQLEQRITDEQQKVREYIDNV
jgi:hypothetical protein